MDRSTPLVEGAATTTGTQTATEEGTKLGLGLALIKAKTCRKVLKVPKCSGLTAGAPGIRSDTAERISTRLMESMPRSDSRSMSSPRVSAG